ncbi:MAG: hypothetical protein K6B17_02655 [Treponema sp.]|nr:hypothetical protein [Treponema sp.]
MFKIKKYYFSGILSFLLFLFTGCDFFHEPVKAFFVEYTETAAVMKHEYTETVAVDKYGVDCLSSGQDKEILLYFRNPQMYTLLLGITSASGEAGNTTFSVAQTPDKSIAKITLKEDFLTSLECGGIFSPTVTLVEKKSMRRFADYSFNLKINSVPPAPQSAVVLVTSEEPKKYVLCFNLPDHSDVSGIHRDIKTLTVESNGSVKNRKIFLKPASGNVSVYADEELLTPLTDVKTSVTAGEITANTDVGAAQLDFTAGDNPVYIFTGDNLVPITNNISYKITLTDECGLSATASTSVYSQKLNAPTATALSYADNESVSLNDTASTEIIQNDDGAGYVKLILPTQSTTGLSVSSCTVDYKIYGGTSFDTLLGEGSVSSSKEIPVPPVECKIRAYARNPAYVSSDYTWFHVKPLCTKLYVDAAGSENGWGTKNKPVNKIKTAIDKEVFADKTNSENTIVLLSDVEDGGISLSGYNLTLLSQNSDGNDEVHTITPSASGSNFMSLKESSDINIENICISGFTGSSNGGAFNVEVANLTLNNVELSGNSGINGGALYLSSEHSFVALTGKSVVKSNTASSGSGAYVGNKDAILVISEDSYFALSDEIYLCKNSMLRVSGLCTASKVACIKPFEYPEDPVAAAVKLLKASDDEELNSEFCNTKLEVARNSDKPDLEYYVVYSDIYKCGILSAGTSAYVKTSIPDEVNFHQFYMPGLLLKFYATDGLGNVITPQSSSIKLKLRSDILEEESATNGYPEITKTKLDKYTIKEDGTLDDGIPEIEDEKVFVELSIRVSGLVYTDRQELSPEAKIADSGTYATVVNLINNMSDTSGITLELAGNFTVDDSTPLLGYDGDHKFNGIFDGNGHTITIKKTRSSGDIKKAAVADYVGPKGVIKNVVVDGTYNYGSLNGGYLAGIALTNEGLIINCVNYLNSNINVCRNTGGIVVTNRGKIINCANFGNIKNSDSIGWAMVNGILGGICGSNSGGRIENCFNYGTIEGTINSALSYCPNSLPGAIVGEQNSNGTGYNCYWREGCVKKSCSSKGKAYNSYAFKNSEASFFWSYGCVPGDSDCHIDFSSKNSETFIYSCGTFASASSDIVAGNEQNSERAQTLQYTGNLLKVMNNYVNGKSKKYSFNGENIDLLEWEADPYHEDYPKLKFE